MLSKEEYIKIFKEDIQTTIQQLNELEKIIKKWEYYDIIFDNDKLLKYRKKITFCWFSLCINEIINDTWEEIDDYENPLIY